MTVTPRNIGKICIVYRLNKLCLRHRGRLLLVYKQTGLIVAKNMLKVNPNRGKNKPLFKKNKKLKESFNQV